MRPSAWLATLLWLGGVAVAQQRQPWTPVDGDVTPHFQTLIAPGVAPAAIHVNATGCPLATGTPLTAQYDWNFGDPAGKYDRLPGWVAAHVYDRPGTYAITLTVTDEAGHVGRTQGHVVIRPDQRLAYYVAPGGSDANDGLSDAHALASASAAFAKLAGYAGRADPGHIILLFKAGGTYPASDALVVRGPDVVVGRYGDGPRPVLLLSHGRGKARGMIEVDGKCDGVMVQHLTFASPYAPATPGGVADKTGIQCLFPRGHNVAVRECDFRDVDDGVNALGFPAGLLVQDCDARGITDLRAYLVWGQGTDHAYIGNRVANSTREHCIRMSELHRVLVYGNDLTNVDRGAADRGDGRKGCVEMQWGSWAYIAGNRVRLGPVRTGPRGAANEAATTSTDWCAIDGNDLDESQVQIHPGSHHIMVRNNVQHMASADALVNVDRPDAAGRTSGDLTVAHNTGVSAGTSGTFLGVWGRVDGLAVADNLFVAPRLRLGNQSGGVAVRSGGLSAFTAVSHDLWPGPGDDGRACWLGGSGRRPGDYLTAADWAATPPVDGDRFANGVTVDARGIPAPGSPADGAAHPFPGTSFDHDGHPRPATGPQTAGAFEQRPPAVGGTIDGGR